MKHNKPKQTISKIASDIVCIISLAIIVGVGVVARKIKKLKE